jgi:pseudouridine-5'-monophosphatase
VPPEACVVVEYSPAGVAAARAAGMRIVAVPDPGVGRAPFDGVADLVVDSLAHIDPDVLLA